MLRRAALWLCLAVAVLGTVPEPPRIGAKGLSTVADCSGPVGFSATGMDRVHPSGLLSYRTTLVDRGVGFSRETGEFTVHCPGIYHIAFAAHSHNSNTTVSLKKRDSNSTWTDVLSAGTTDGGTGSNQVLLDLNVGDQTGVWVTRGSLTSDQDSPTTSFLAFRIAKK